MKHQYFGDVNDYRKYGLLRALQSGHEGNLLVAWMLTTDDGSSDGGFRKYLQEPARWAHYDPELFEGLHSLLGSKATPSVSSMERSGLLPRAAYHSAPVPDALRERETWRTDLLRAAAGVDLVFLDPDNGVEVRSKPAGRKDSSKYVRWVEVEDLWSAGCSVLIYQHFCREKRQAFAVRLMAELRARTGAGTVGALETPHVLFLLALQERHGGRLGESLRLLEERWGGEMMPMGFDPIAAAPGPA